MTNHLDMTSALSRHTGIKLQLLDLGGLRGDEAYFFRGHNRGTKSNPNPVHRHRDLKLISALIEHPRHGLLLYEVGGPPDPEKHWPPAVDEVFPYTYRPEHRLDNAIAAAGHDIRDIQGVIIGHLHTDHAGGLEFFRGTDVPIYVHEEELKNAFFVEATGQDSGFTPHCLDISFNWQPIGEAHVELFRGIELLHTPGHTPGLMGLLVHLDQTGPLYFASDHLIFEENLDGPPLGWLMHNDHAWHESRRRIKRLVQSRDAQIIYGHDPVNFERFAPAPYVHA
ncbi:MAG: N-acyl homoserine lactonase family protein [Gordonia sp. (in: high G+C Gram-positive bacteria)]